MGVTDSVNDKGFWVTFDLPAGAPEIEIPACHTGEDNKVIWDLKEFISPHAQDLAMKAYLNGKPVELDVFGSCHDGVVKVRNIHYSPQP